nr:aldo/keto reductase [Variovorax boronicumulans]
MHSIPLPGTGPALPALGLGTWRIGESKARRADEVKAVRSALEMGWRLVDTAEMYGEGGSEEVIGQALAEAQRGGLRREELFLVSKVYPHNASRQGTVAACERSLRRLGVDRLDLYLLHWRGSVPLAETVEALQALVAAGRIARWGVSNFDVDDMQALWSVPGGDACAANQVYYSITERGPAHSLLPWLRAHGVALMAYSPLDQGALADDAALQALAERQGCTTAQLALAWLLAQPGVNALPKAVGEAHLRENLAAAELVLQDEVQAELARRYPAPAHKPPLAMI